MRGGADVVHLAAAHEVVERPQRFLLIHLEDGAVDLVKVDGVDAQTLQTCFASPHHMIAAVAAIVGTVAHGEIGFGSDHQLVAHAALGDQASQHDFGAALVVGIGDIEEIDAGFQRHVEHALGFLVGAATAEIHHAETEGGDFDARAGKGSIVHGITWAGRNRNIWWGDSGKAELRRVFILHRSRWGAKVVNSASGTGDPAVDAGEPCPYR